MKNTILITTLLLATYISNAQITLTNATHGLQENYEYTTLNTEYLSPGASGSNVLWDFTQINCSDSKHTWLLPAYTTYRDTEFSSANIAIESGANYFYFQTDDFANNYLGMVTPTSLIKFDMPIKKIEYPFTFGDFTSTNYTGTGIHHNSIHSTISGHYWAKADAWGTLILPEGVTLQNVLRVQTIDTITETACNSTTVINQKYLWYAAESRYPLFVTRISTQIQSDETITVTKKSYYNATAVESIVNETVASIDKTIENSDIFNIYPNPYIEKVKIKYNLLQNSDIKIETVSETGAITSVLLSQKNQKGENTVNYQPQQTPNGISFIRFTVNGKVFMKKIVKID